MFKVNNKDTRTTSFDVVYVSDILNCDLTALFSVPKCYSTAITVNKL